MRRIYESSAIDRDDDDPYRPNESDAKPKPQATRTLPAGRLSNALTPTWLRYRAISVSIETPQSVYEQQTPVPITVTMHNSLPFPVTIRTRSPVRWSWHVNGYPEGSQVDEEPTGNPAAFEFDRGERKRFTRTWPQLFKVSESEWADCDPGEYTLSAQINVDEPRTNALYDEQTIRIE